MTHPGRRAPTSEPDWLTLGQAAKFLGVAQSTIRKWSDQGRVPAFYTPGGHRRYRRRDLETFLDRSGPGGRSEGPLVLVVDDDARLREFVRVNLEMEGYSVREASGAEEALAAIEDTAPEIVPLVLAAVVFGIAESSLLKALIPRARPHDDPLVAVPHTHSFPSGHAASAFAAATVLARFEPRGRPWFYLLAAAIAFSRIY